MSETTTLPTQPITLPAVNVVPQTDKHLNFKSLWAGLRGVGMMILGMNMYLLDHPDILAVGAKKWIWLGPLVAGIGAMAESVQAQKAKQTRMPVNFSGTPTDPDTLLDVALNMPPKTEEK